MKNFLTRTSICLLLLLAVIGSLSAARIETNEPIKLVDGQTMKSIYYFAHWWDPWKSDDAVVTSDLQKMKSLKLNTVCLDHEVSQSIDRDWFWLDREFKLVGQEKMFILPWLQLHCVDRLNLMKFSHLPLKAAINQDKGVEEDCVSFRDKEFAEALARYVNAYLDRYKDNPALLRVTDGRNTRPVVGLVMEIGWRNASGDPLSFDEETNEYFRKWMKASYKNLAQLNSKWGTSYKSFDEIDPCDKTIFNYNFEDKNNMPASVKEHVKFRGRVISDAFDSVISKVSKRHKDVLFAVEVAYPFSLDTDEAIDYKWKNANEIRIINFADIVCIRTTGNTSKDKVNDDQKSMMISGKKVILSYRYFANTTTEKAISYAIDGALAANAIGYYSWNETADDSSSIFNKPEQQDMLKIMFETYDLLNEPSKRHNLVLPEVPVTPAAIVEPANTAVPIEAPIDQPVIAPSVPDTAVPAPAAPAPAPAAPESAPVPAPTTPAPAVPTPAAG